ncbi:hypothetical protein FXB40_32325 [Bradyrhizobium rifense]|uniref:Uncharacterized protein n=1 Tax=Bradyrhizobium rifense TaxID=515499 RepID=A0A5D3KHG1_9BRAD|nr:hypothetical protein FXB40_32325 [Bradyrhizobium rifense]
MIVSESRHLVVIAWTVWRRCNEGIGCPVILRCESWDATRPMRSLEGCTAPIEPGRRPSRLAEEASTSG